VVPVGDWGRPADLHLTEDSLKGVTLSVRCGRVYEDGKLHERTYPLCQALERQMEAIGAMIAGRDDRADFTLWYVEKGATQADSSGLSTLAFSLSGGIIPGISSRPSAAELRVSDSRGVLLETAPLKIENIQIFGWGALIAYYQKTENQQKREVGAKFFQFARNRVASQALRLKFAGGAR
jgi:hypothetical protein